MSAQSALAKLGIGGERSRRAQEQLARASSDLVVALRRTLPFLTRKKVGLVATGPRTTLFAELDVLVPNLAFEARFLVGPARTAGVLAIDGMGLARILDGVLGGGGDEGTLPVALEKASLSSAQMALAGRVFEGVMRVFVETLRARLGLAVVATGPSTASDSGACVVLSFAIAGGGVIALAVPMSVLSDAEDAAPDGGDSRIAAAMIDVEVDVVAELGRVRMPLQALASLQVGDVLQLPISLDERARISAGGAVLYHGRPTATGLAIGIAIERHAT